MKVFVFENYFALCIERDTETGEILLQGWRDDDPAFSSSDPKFFRLPNPGHGRLALVEQDRQPQTEPAPQTQSKNPFYLPENTKLTVQLLFNPDDGKIDVLVSNVNPTTTAANIPLVELFTSYVCKWIVSVTYTSYNSITILRDAFTWRGWEGVHAQLMGDMQAFKDKLDRMTLAEQRQLWDAFDAYPIESLARLFEAKLSNNT